MLNLVRSIRPYQAYSSHRFYSANRNNTQAERFETVFSFPFVKYIAMFNRLKIYHLAGTGVVVPTSGLLEVFNVIPSGTLPVASLIGITAATVLGVGSIPFKNIIGFIYISDDNKKIKISSVDYWGRRNDKIIQAEDWVPMMDLKPSTIDAIYLSPRLTDGTKYKLFLKFGEVKNLSKMNTVLE